MYGWKGGLVERCKGDKGIGVKGYRWIGRKEEKKKGGEKDMKVRLKIINKP